MSRLATSILNTFRRKITSQQAEKAAELWAQKLGSQVPAIQREQFKSTFVSRVTGRPVTETQIDWLRYRAFLSRSWYSQPVSTADRGGLASMLQAAGIDNPKQALPADHATMRFLPDGGVVLTTGPQFSAKVDPNHAMGYC